MDEQHGDPMPVFVIKAKDQLALDAVAAYRQLCLDHDLPHQAIEVTRAYAEINGWQQRHPDRVALPEHEHIPATAGADLTGVPAEQALRLGQIHGEALRERDELLRLLWNVYSRWCVIAGDDVDRHDMDEVCEAVEDPAVTARILEILGHQPAKERRPVTRAADLKEVDVDG